MALFSTLNGLLVSSTAFYKGIIYTGTGASLSVGGVGFQPDLVWIKDRDATNDHYLFDSNHSTDDLVSSNNTGIGNNSTFFTSFDADGFTIGSGGGTNTNTNDYVAWCFRNIPELFEALTYTGNGTSQNVSHTLSVTPELIIVKNIGNGLSNTENWAVYHKDLNGGTNPEDYRLILNNNDAETNNTSIWDSTAPTSTQFSVGADNNSNESGETHIAYLFASKAGLSDVGTYTGDGGSSNKVTLTFQPSFVMIKRRDNNNNWLMVDSARGTGVKLFPSTNNVEAPASIEFNSDGFTLESSSPDANASGGEYVYVAVR